MLEAAAQYQFVRQVVTPFDVTGWRLAANAVRLVATDGRADGKPQTPTSPPLQQPRGCPGAVVARDCSALKAVNIRPGRSGTKGVARMALPLGRRGPRKTQEKTRTVAPGGRAERLPANIVLLSDYGARC